jgi:hypothetical protein
MQRMSWEIRPSLTNSREGLITLNIHFESPESLLIHFGGKMMGNGFYLGLRKD